MELGFDVAIYPAPEKGEQILCTLVATSNKRECRNCQAVIQNVGRIWALISVKGERYKLHLPSWLVYAKSTKPRNVPNPNKVRGFAAPKRREK